MSKPEFSSIFDIARSHLVFFLISDHPRRDFTENSFLFFSTASALTISSLLTLFPKCFSSFLHSTCSLSVSYIYLALEEVYLPLSALISEYTTLCPVARLDSSPHTGLSPSLAVLSCTLTRPLPLGRPSSDYNSPVARRFSFWAFPSSVAPTKGILVSFFSSA